MIYNSKTILDIYESFLLKKCQIPYLELQVKAPLICFPIHLFCSGQSIPLTLETSDRISQRIENHILIHLLKEVMRYTLVEEKRVSRNVSFGIPDITNTRSALARLARFDKSSVCDR